MSGLPTAPALSAPGSQAAIGEHYARLMECRRCPAMASAPVSGRPVLSRVMLVGQAPGNREPVLGRPFAWTAGKTLFRWFQDSCGVPEEQVRSSVYLAAVCRCFPGKKSTGGDRVPDADEISRCGSWMDAEIRLLKPSLVIPIGKLAIGQFIEAGPLTEMIGCAFRVNRAGEAFDLIPLPHPSGASPWHRMEPGKTLLQRALARIKAHPAFVEDVISRRPG